jgi:predicted dehydrogenase
MRARELVVGMIGAGSMARHHLDAWSRSDGVRVVAIYNRTQSKAEALAQEFAIPSVCAEVDSLICREDVGAVSISMPHSLHHPLALAAIAAGKHVFCEKPLATTLRDAREMWEQAEQRGIKTGIQFGHRFSPALNRLRALLLDGYVGQVQRLECSWCFDWARDPSFPLVWRFKRDLAGAGALADLGVYAIDAARWLIGEFRSVSGCLQTSVRERPVLAHERDFAEIVRMFSEGTLPPAQESGPVENEDECVFVASFENGAHGVFWASRMQDEQRLSVYGSQGVLTWHLRGETLYGRRSGHAELEPIPLPTNAAAPPFVSRFVASIRDGVERSPSFYDGLKAQEVIEAVLQSAHEQRWVPLPATEHAVTG